MDLSKEKLLPPPMGWNSWYCFSESVSDANIRQTALAMKERGLSKHGWSYINIDDCWQGDRGGEFNAIQGNERFENMTALGEYIHSLDLKFGLYSTPWIGSYAGFRGGSEEGNVEAEKSLPIGERNQPYQIYGRFPSARNMGVNRTGSNWLFGEDAKQWAKWGVDFIKVDWFPNDVETTQRIYDDLQNCGRDIVLSLSNESPLENAKELSKLANLWRISGDINDTWKSIYHNGVECVKSWMPYAKYGHYIDPDMLMIGAIGIPNRENLTYKKSELSIDEQKFQFALWSMLSAPLILSCDIENMDDVTFEILTNDDIISIDQDSLGLMPTIEELSAGVFGYTKQLADGNRAFGVFNMGDSTQNVDCGKIFANNEQVKDLYTKEKSISSEISIPSHGAKVYKLFK